MVQAFYHTFALDLEANEFLEEQKYQLRKSKSAIIRETLKFFKNNPEKLKEIMEDPNNVNQD